MTIVLSETRILTSPAPRKQPTATTSRRGGFGTSSHEQQRGRAQASGGEERHAGGPKVYRGRIDALWVQRNAERDTEFVLQTLQARTAELLEVFRNGTFRVFLCSSLFRSFKLAARVSCPVLAMFVPVAAALSCRVADTVNLPTIYMDAQFVGAVSSLCYTSPSQLRPSL